MAAADDGVKLNGRFPFVNGLAVQFTGQSVQLGQFGLGCFWGAERKFWEEFAEAKPRILGGIFTAISETLKVKDEFENIKNLNKLGKNNNCCVCTKFEKEKTATAPVLQCDPR